MKPSGHVSKAIDEYWHKQGMLFSRLYQSWNPLLVANRVFLRHRLGIVLGLMERGEACRAVDVGCGSGEFAEILARNYREVVAIDYSQVMLQLARERSRSNNLHWALGDCRSLPLERDSVDRLFALGLLDYVHDADRVVGEFFSVLREGGSAVFTIPKSPSLFEPLRWSARLRKKLFQIPPIMNLYTRRRLLDALRRVGFEVLKTRSLWTTMWIVKVRKPVMEPFSDR